MLVDIFFLPFFYKPTLLYTFQCNNNNRHNLILTAYLQTVNSLLWFFKSVSLEKQAIIPQTDYSTIFTSRELGLGSIHSMLPSNNSPTSKTPSLRMIIYCHLLISVSNKDEPCETLRPRGRH